MIDATNVHEYIADFPVVEVKPGVFRKVVKTLMYGVIYLHPDDPRFGCDEDRNFYSFRCPRGHTTKGNRVAAVNYGKPKLIKGTKDKKDVYWITIETHKKVRKEKFISEIIG